MIIAILLLLILGASLLVGGAYVIAGSGVALLSAGTLSIVAAVILRRGLNG